jgi:hypothetical protein
LKSVEGRVEDTKRIVGIFGLEVLAVLVPRSWTMSRTTLAERLTNSSHVCADAGSVSEPPR